MGLSEYHKDGVGYPILNCDKCGERIEKLSSAIVAYCELYRPPLGMFHKVRCDPGRELCPYSVELSAYLFNLIWNLNMGKKIRKGNIKQIRIESPDD
jgi:hypothetical protein